MMHVCDARGSCSIATPTQHRLPSLLVAHDRRLLCGSSSCVFVYPFADEQFGSTTMWLPWDFPPPSRA